MQTHSLDNKNIAILATNGFEEIELTAPLEELKNYGAKVSIVSDQEIITAWRKTKWSKDIKADYLIDDFEINGYDALLIPGGVINSDKLRRKSKAVEIVKEFNDKNKLVAAICHGPQMLIEANLVQNKEVTGHNAIKTDLINAGANYSENKVIKDENMVTAQSDKDVAGFLKMVVNSLKD